MKNSCSAAVALVGALAFVSPSQTARAAATKSGTEAGAQKASCDAKCRQEYQGNSAAIDACIRNCGATGPASAGARTANAGESKPAEAKAVKSGKSNSSDRAIHAGTTDPTPAEATTVKSSKSNSSEREVTSTEPAPGPGEAAKFHGNKLNQSKTSNLNLSKSNINHEAAPTGSTGPAESTTIKGSKSNSSDRQASASVSGTVTNVDAGAKTISLSRKDGSVIVMDASKLAGGLPKVGQTVNVQYVEASGKLTAQSITVGDAATPGKGNAQKN